MAQHTVIIDDLDGSPDAVSITYTINGEEYAIDLNEKNFGRMLKALAPFLDKSVHLNKSKAAARKQAAAQREYSIDALRVWAEANDISVPKRGRIPAITVARYLADLDTQAAAANRIPKGA